MTQTFRILFKYGQKKILVNCFVYILFVLVYKVKIEPNHNLNYPPIGPLIDLKISKFQKLPNMTY